MGRKTLIAAMVVVLAGISAVAINDALAQPAQPAEALRVGVCDIVHLVRNYERVHALNEELERRRGAIEAEGQRRVAQVQQLEAELQSLNEQSAEYQRTLETLLTRQVEIKGWQEAQETLLLHWHFTTTREMFREALSTVADVARDQGLHVVLTKEPAELQGPTSPDLVEEFVARRKVLYSDSSLDITPAVLARMNARYRSGGSRR